MTALEEPAATRTATYLYGIVGAGGLDADVFAGITSVDGARPIRLVPAGDLAAIVSDVPLEEFAEETLPARLNDLAWLEQAARAHEGVLERALERASVVPFRFCTIYRREDDLVGFVVERRDELLRVLEQVDGRVELGVKGLVARETLERRLRSLTDEDDGADAGRAYLLRRQREQQLAAESARFLADCAAAAHARLEAAAVASAVSAVRPARPADRETMFLNAAYLVMVGDESLAREAAALAGEYEPFGIRFELTGPWPPYNFVPRDAVQA
jgi:hypothetical protein